MTSARPTTLQGPAINKNDPAEFYSDPSMSYEPGMQRGNPDNKDWYSFSGITLTYKFALGKKRNVSDLYSAIIYSAMGLKEEINKEKIPVHVAVIMDGNGRWARKHGFAGPRAMRRG